MLLLCCFSFLIDWMSVIAGVEKNGSTSARLLLHCCVCVRYRDTLVDLLGFIFVFVGYI